MITDYFLFILFVVVFASAFLYILIFTLPSIRNRLQEISALISIPLSVLAVISSVGSIYYITEILRHPDLDIHMQFYEERGNRYCFRADNIGNDNARALFINGFYIDSKTKIKVEKFQLTLPGLTRDKGWVTPYCLTKVSDSGLYIGLIELGCENCREIKKWMFKIYTKEKKVDLERVAPEIGLRVEQEE